MAGNKTILLFLSLFYYSSSKLVTGNLFVSKEQRKNKSQICNFFRYFSRKGKKLLQMQLSWSQFQALLLLIRIGEGYLASSNLYGKVQSARHPHLVSVYVQKLVSYPGTINVFVSKRLY